MQVTGSSSPPRRPGLQRPLDPAELPRPRSAPPPHPLRGSASSAIRQPRATRGARSLAVVMNPRRSGASGLPQAGGILIVTRPPSPRNWKRRATRMTRRACPRPLSTTRTGREVPPLPCRHRPMHEEVARRPAVNANGKRCKNFCPLGLSPGSTQRRDPTLAPSRALRQEPDLRRAIPVLKAATHSPPPRCLRALAASSPAGCAGLTAFIMGTGARLGSRRGGAHENFRSCTAPTDHPASSILEAGAAQARRCARSSRDEIAAVPPPSAGPRRSSRVTGSSARASLSRARASARVCGAAAGDLRLTRAAPHGPPTKRAGRLSRPCTAATASARSS